MKILVERDPFSDAIGAAIRASGTRNTIPILNNVLLRPNGAEIGIASTNLDNHFEASVAAEIIGPSADGAVTVLASALHDIITRMPKGAQISLEWGDGTNQNRITVKHGRSRYSVLTLPAAEFPELKVPEEPASFVIPAKELVAALSAVRFAISKDQSRYYLNGVFLHPSDDVHAALGSSREPRLVFCACDGSNLARFSIAMPDGAQKSPAVILPEVAIPEIIRLASDVEEDIAIAISRALASFSVAGKSYTTKLIDGTFPDYMRVIPSENQRRMVIDSDELSTALSRLRAIGDGMRMWADIDGGLLKLTLANHEVGDAEEEIPIDQWEGDPLKLGLRASALLSMLESAQSDQCLFRFGHVGAPAIMQPWRANVADVTRTYLTMPVERK